MNLKLSILLLLSFSLLSCQNNEARSVESIVLEVKEDEQIETDELIYICDPMMPYYIMLDEDYIIGNQKIGIGETLNLPFLEPQKIKNIKIFSESTFELTLNINNNTHNISVQKGENTFELVSEGLVDNIDVSLVEGSVDSFPIDTMLIQGYHQLTKEAYVDYEINKKWISDLHLAINWQNDPKENLKLIPELKNIYSSDQLMVYGEAIDFYQLKSSAETCVGYPVLITGPVESFEVFNDYMKVTIKSGLTDTAIVVYLDDFQEELDFVNIIGIFLGYDEQLKFYSSSVLN